jgi:hypothetical protein
MVEVNNLSVGREKRCSVVYLAAIGLHSVVKTNKVNSMGTQETAKNPSNTPAGTQTGGRFPTPC